jgi:hypothetical protein
VSAAPIDAGLAGARLPGLRARIRQASPSWRVGTAGAVLWAAAMAASAATNLTLAGWGTGRHVATVALVFALGAAAAFPFGFAAANLLAGKRHPEARFAAALLCFTAATLGITAGFYALDYRQYYANWHAEPLSAVWLIQLAFTTAGALVQFAVTGVRLYFPIGFLALLLVSLWFARRAR